MVEVQATTDRQAAAATVATKVIRHAVAPIPAAPHPALRTAATTAAGVATAVRQVAAATAAIQANRHAVAPIPAGPLPALRAAATVAADITAHPPAEIMAAAHAAEIPAEDRAEATRAEVVAARTTSLPAADMETTKRFRPPHHPTPHSPSGGSARGLLSSLQNEEETMEPGFRPAKFHPGNNAGSRVFRAPGNQP